MCIFFGLNTIWKIYCCIIKEVPFIVIPLPKFGTFLDNKSFYFS